MNSEPVAVGVGPGPQDASAWSHEVDLRPSVEKF